MRIAFPLLTRPNLRPSRLSAVAVKTTPTSAVQAQRLKKHLKRLNAPKHCMLNKLGGACAPKTSSGPHKARECLPLILILRIKLKYPAGFIRKHNRNHLMSCQSLK